MSSSFSLSLSFFSEVSSNRIVEPAFDPNYGEVTNKRVLYGEYNAWGLVTASGDKSEFNVEDILPSGYVGGSVNVIRKSDLRPDGRPYFRFEYYLGNHNDDYFFVKSVQGAPWQNTPIVWTGASNSWMASYQHANRMTEMTADFSYNQKSRDIGMQRERVKNDLELTKEAVGAITGTSAIDAVINMGTTAYNYANTALDYTRQGLHW